MRYVYFSISYRKSKYAIGNNGVDESKTFTNRYLKSDFGDDPEKTIEDCIYYFISREIMPKESSTVLGSSIFFVMNRVAKCKQSTKFVLTIPPSHYCEPTSSGIFDIDVSIEIDDGTINYDEYEIL